VTKIIIAEKNNFGNTFFEKILKSLNLKLNSGEQLKEI
jgi:hypothetical protein